jgi:hypothetical protein
MPRAKKPMVLMGLIKERAAKDFLADLANYKPFPLFEGRTEEAFLHRWAWMFPEFDVQKDDDRQELATFVLLQLNSFLQEAWKAASLREREWLVHRIRWYYNVRRVERSAEGQKLLQQNSQEARAELARLQDGLPPISPVDVSLQFFQQILNQAALCQNPLCAHPYFLVKKFGQKYCSPACATPSLRKAKQQWWTAQGKEWRQQQQKKKRKSKTKEHAG